MMHNSQPVSETWIRANVLRHYDEFESFDKPIKRISVGIINHTFAWGEHYIIQRLNAIFDPRVTLDAMRVAEPLSDVGIVLPRYMPTRRGAFFVEVDEAGLLGEQRGIWRVMTRIAGRTYETVSDDTQMISASRVLGLWHTTLRQHDVDLVAKPRRIHDYGFHSYHLQMALRRFRNHRLYAQVSELAQQQAQMAELINYRVMLEHPKRIVHGDPKISNFVFNEDNTVAGVIDLDTISRMPIAFEVGDAIRSWSNRFAETDVVSLNTERAAQALVIYHEQTQSWLSRSEQKALSRAPALIALELSVRFARDALAEDYFGFDPDIAPHAEHSLMRARGQFQLAQLLYEAIRDFNRVL